MKIDKVIIKQNIERIKKGLPLTLPLAILNKQLQPAWYREVNKDLLAKKRKIYYKANEDELAEKRKIYYEANKNELAKKGKAYYKANKDRLKAKKRKVYREADKVKEKNG